MRRDSFPDVLRGFALLGIVLVNAPFLAINTVVGIGAVDVSSLSNFLPAFLITSLALGKFYLLFSFLFGYSAGYVLKADRKNIPRWIARAVFLILFGALHAIFLFHGDILFAYGILAIALVGFYFRSDRVLRIWSRVLYFSAAGLFTVFALLLLVAEKVLGEDLGETITSSSLDTALVDGSFFEIAVARFDLWSSGLAEGFLLQGILAFAAFLVGVLASRRKFLADGAKPETMKRMAIWGLSVGLPIQLTAGWFFLQNQLAESFSSAVELSLFVVLFFTAPVLSAGYLGSLWFIHQKYQERFEMVSAAGRHSLSVYIGQSVILSVLFSSWGFGLFGALSLSAVTAIAFGSWLLLALMALLNSKYRSSGPLEWLLQRLTSRFRV